MSHRIALPLEHSDTQGRQHDSHQHKSLRQGEPQASAWPNKVMRPVGAEGTPDSLEDKSGPDFRLPSFSALMASANQSTTLAPPPQASGHDTSIREIEKALNLVPGYGAPRRANRKPPLRPGLPLQAASAPLDAAAAAAKWIDAGGRKQRAICFGCNRTFKKRDGRETHWARYTDCEARHIVEIQGSPYVVDYNEMLEIRRKSKARKERKELKRTLAENARAGELPSPSEAPVFDSGDI